jgi:hypothetical protein
MTRPQQRKKVIAVAVALLAVGLMSTTSQVASGRSGQRRHGDRAERGQHDRSRPDAHADKDDSLTVGVTIGGDYSRSRGHDRWQRMPHRPGRFERRWVEPVYGTSYDACGRRVAVIVHQGYYTRQWVQSRTYRHGSRYRRHSYRSRGGRGHHNSSGLVISGTFRF